MIRLATAALRRPRLTVAVWLGVVAIIAPQGAQLQRRLSPPDLTVPGTGAARELRLATAHFGPNVTVPILLSGPRAALDRAGAKLTQDLDHRPGVTAVSPWAGAQPGSAHLRPAPNQGMVVALFRRTPGQALAVADEAKRLIAADVHAPVVAHASGQAVIGQGLKDASLKSSEDAEKIALPFLMLVLVLVFGSPVAAAVPILFGGATVLAGLGMISLAALAVGIEPLAVSLASMIGLALGVDYSLLIVSRFREELARGSPPANAAAAASVATAGRTVLSAGAALIAALAITLALAPGALFLSAVFGAGIVVVVSVISAVMVVPSLLAVLGSNVDRWRIGRRRTTGAGAFVGAARRVSRHPRLASALILAALLALAAPASGFSPGAPGVGQLPASSRVRQDYELVARVMGRGWTGPLEVLIIAPHGTVTTQRRLEELGVLQSRIAHDRDVKLVIGPGPIARASSLAALPARIRGAVRTSQRDLGRLESGIGQVGDGVQQLQTGLASAQAGANAIGRGARAALLGTKQIGVGLRAAAAGAAAIQDGIARVETGARQLIAGTDAAGAGARRLARAVAEARAAVAAGLPGLDRATQGLAAGRDAAGRLREPVGVVRRELDAARQALAGMSVGRVDPKYAAAVRAVATAEGAVSGRDPSTGQRVVAGYDGLDASLAQLHDGLAQAVSTSARFRAQTDQLESALVTLQRAARRLAAGVGRIAGGQQRLAGGLGALSAGAARLTPGISRLAGGTQSLEAGLGRLVQGPASLAAGLGYGGSQTGRLDAGVARIKTAVRRENARVPNLVPDQIETQSPGFFHSGYLTLATLDGAPRPTRRLSGVVVSLDNGGQAARFLVIPRSGPNDRATDALRQRLARLAGGFDRQMRSVSAVGGEAALLADFDHAAAARMLPIIAALSLVTLLVLIQIFRAPILALVAVALTLVTVGATYGVMVLLLQGTSPPLGGPGYVSAIAAIGVFSVIFALSIDYVVFLVMRMREAFGRHGSPDAAIDDGLMRTGRVVSGAAVIMVGVFVSFALTTFSGIREFGVGLAVAVAIDATLVRLVMLPAVMRMLGRWSWWLPGWLDDLLPGPSRVGGRAAPPMTTRPPTASGAVAPR